MKHTYYVVCDNCGAFLDPGETCTCKEQKTKENDHIAEPRENAFPAPRVGVCRIPMNWLAVCPPEEI